MPRDADLPIPTLQDIRDAAATIAGCVIRTPLLPAPRLSQVTGAEVLVKYENMQATNSFKERGAVTRLTSLTEAERRNGVIAMSAGNHAQAVAYHAARLGIPATIVMPETTPFVKVSATQAHGARVVLFGETLADAQVEAERLIAEEGFTLVHPYNCPHIVRGQGTIGLEILEDDPGIDTIIVPIGGGGLISGISIAATSLKPGIEVIGVETRLYPSMWCALRDQPANCGGQTLAEGIAVKNVEPLTMEICRQNVADILLVDEDHIERAVNAYLTLQKTMAEGAGAAGLAAMLAAPERFRGRRVGLVLAGGNIDPRLLAAIMVRELAREERVVAIRVTIHDRPGMLGEIASVCGRMGANILQVEHHRLYLNVPAKGASIDLILETRNAAHAVEIVTALEGRGFQVTRLDAVETGM